MDLAKLARLRDDHAALQASYKAVAGRLRDALAELNTLGAETDAERLAAAQDRAARLSAEAGALAERFRHSAAIMASINEYAALNGN